VKSGDLTYDECMSYIYTERFPDAIPSLKKLKQSYEIPGRYNGEVYYSIVMAIYTYYLGKGDIASARNIINEASQICGQRESSANNDFTRRLLCCRGQLESMLKNYDEALSYFHIANNYFEEANEYGEQYLVLLTNMGIAYLGKGDFLSSKIYMDEMKDKFVQLYGSFENIKDEDQFIFWAYYGLMLQSIGHESDAEKYYLNVINNCKRTPASSEAYLLSANNLSNIYLKNGRWEEGVKILEELHGPNSLSSYVISQNLAIGYLFTNRYQESISALHDMNESSISNIEQIFSSFTGLEREHYWDETSNSLINVNNIIAHRTNDKRAISMAYNNMLLCKNLSLNAVRIIDEFVAKAGDNDLKEQYKRYQGLKSEFAYKTTSFDEKDSLRREINLTERIILSSTGNLGRWIKQESKKWEDVRNELREGEIAIEYCHIPKDEKIPITEFQYGMFVLGYNYEAPVFIALDDIKVINRIFHYDNSDPLFINELYTTQNNNLYNKLWKPLLPYLNGIHTIYYSTVGPLNDLNYDVLCGEDGKMLSERYKMVRVSSTANIKKTEVEKYQTSILYGNIKYDESATDMSDTSSVYSTFTGTDVHQELAQRSENERGRWGPIPSTKKEIDNIEALFKKKGIKVSIFEENAANEESFKNLSGKSPEILHMATHGFVIDTPQRAEGNKFVASTNVYSQKDSYMMWAGLMLAGGNNIWQGKFDIKNVEDGILTADEISQLDLSNTKLVVLSACETAKGMIDPVDGVYGLQRAFKMAGVETIVMSLWKVQDDATSMLMTQFYTYLNDGTEKHQALWKAMKDVKDKYKDPYYWAGFIMLD
jgi:CHAT domain-containing protein